MNESKTDGYIRRIGNALKDDEDVKAGISLTHEAAKEILQLLRQPEQKVGHWKVCKCKAVDSHGEIYTFDDDYAYCSECNNYVHRKEITIDGDGRFPNYCDECGAKMEVGNAKSN